MKFVYRNTFFSHFVKICSVKASVDSQGILVNKMHYEDQGTHKTVLG